MSENEQNNQTANALFELVSQAFIDIKKQITDLKLDIDSHIDKTNDARSEIKLLKQKVEDLEKDFKELKVDNKEQHKEFYSNFKSLDRVVYKMIGGLVLSGVLVSIIFKLLNKG